MTVYAFGVAAATAAGVVGYFFGPYAAFGIGAIVLIGVVAGCLAQQSMTPAWPAAAPVARASAAPPSGSDGHFTQHIGRWVALAVIVRLGMVVLLNFTSLWIHFAPDADYWSGQGQALYGDWAGRYVASRWGLPEDVERSFVPFYTVLNAIAYGLFSTNNVPMSLLNAAAGLGGAFLFAQLAQQLHGTRVAKLTFIIVALFPSLLVWTCMNIREAWALLAIGAFLFLVNRIRQGLGLMNLALLTVCVGWVYTIRPYLVPLLIGGTALSFITVRARQLPYALIALVAMAIGVQSYGDTVGVTTELLSTESLETTHEMRRNLAFGGSAYGLEADTRTLTGALTYLPMGVLYFLCLPFPWTVQSWRQMLTVPESIIWYYLLYRATRELFVCIRHYLADAAAMVFVTAFIVMAYGLVSGNGGTAYRHRAQVLPVFFVFASASIIRARERRAAEPGRLSGG